MKKVEKEFQQISEFIDKSRNAAVGFMNYAAVATYWAVGAFVSSRLKSASAEIFIPSAFLTSNPPTVKRLHAVYPFASRRSRTPAGKKLHAV